MFPTFWLKNVLNNQEKVSLSINGAQSVRLERGTIYLKNYMKQMQVAFKIYSKFDCILTSVESYEDPSSKNIKITFLVVLLTNVFVLMISKPIVLYRGENLAYKFIKAILEEYECCKKVMKKHFNKNLIMTEKEEEQFQSSNTCWICDKLIDDEKVRGNCHVTEKLRDAAHWSCNINLWQLKKFL